MTTATERAIRVWDLPVRLFHWALVALVLISWATRELGEMEAHRLSGYAILVLVLFRVLWGFMGTRHARFADFVRSPAAMRAHMQDTLAGRRAQFLGHNPAGGWSVLAMLACLFVQAVTGLFLTDDILFDAPFHGVLSKQWTERLDALHEANFALLLVLIGLHVSAIVFYRVAKRENLMVPMLTGRKWVPVDSNAEGVRSSGWWRAPLALAIAVGIVAGALSFAPRSVL
jgi:cytochrome b